MNKRQKKKLKNRAGFFHYKNYKWRVRALYDIMKPTMACSMPYSFKLMMFEYVKNMLFTKPPKKVYTRKYRAYDYQGWVKAIKEIDTSHYIREHDHPVSSDIIPSMSIRMVGDKVHSFSIDADSFKNGYKPGELAVPLPKGPFDGHKSMASAKLSAIRENPEMVSAKLTIEHGDTDRMRRRIMADEYIKGGSAIEYPGSAIIDLRKLADKMCDRTRKERLGFVDYMGITKLKPEWNGMFPTPEDLNNEQGQTTDMQ